MAAYSWNRIVDQLVDATRRLRFEPPVSHVYHPLIYAHAAHMQYCRKFGRPEKAVILLGMNPGPWGMAQTGVPFGDLHMVLNWLGLRVRVGKPDEEHPKRPIMGIGCHRSEVSGKRLWGWARERFNTPERFFSTFWVANYCPLVFMEFSGRNRTPDKLKPSEKETLFAACDRALVQTVERLRPKHVIGVGRFAADRAAHALRNRNVATGCITHPSPANPAANRGWSDLIEKQLASLGVNYSR